MNFETNFLFVKKYFRIIFSIQQEFNNDNHKTEFKFTIKDYSQHIYWCIRSHPFYSFIYNRPSIFVKIQLYRPVQNA